LANAITVGGGKCLNQSMGQNGSEGTVTR